MKTKNCLIVGLFDCLIVGGLLVGCSSKQGAARPESATYQAKECGRDRTPGDPVETPDQKAEAIRKEAAKLRSGYKLNLAMEPKLMEALAVPGISEKTRETIVGDLVREVYSMANTTAYDRSKALIEPILARADLTNNADRIAYTVILADGAFRSMQPDESKRLIDGLWKLPSLKWWDTNAVFNARVAIDRRMRDYDAALKAYRDVMENPKEGVVRRYDCLKASVELWSQDQRYDEGLKTLARWNAAKDGHRSDIFAWRCRLLREKLDFKGARAMALEVGKGEFKSEREKTGAAEQMLAELLRTDLAQNDLEQAMKDIAAYEAPFMSGVNPMHVIADDVLRMAATRLDWAKVVTVFEKKFLGFEFKWGFNWQIRDRFVTYFHALQAHGRGKEIPGLVAKIVASPKVGDEDRAFFTVLGTTAGAGKVDAAAVKAALGKLEPKVKLRVLANAAKYFVAEGDRATALALYDVRSSLMIVRTRNSAAVRYVKDAPIDVGRWLTSGLMTDDNKHIVNIPFGKEEADKLILDVSVQRDVGKEGGESETYFYVCWDEFGVHLLFVGKDPEWRKVLAGAVGGTGYEMYICFGEGAPTYQWLIGDKGKTDFLDYASKGKAYRPLQDHLVMYTAPVEGGFATAMNIAWSACYERLPDNGDTWPFEMIHWSRGGGVTWGGETIWEISRWGRWTFEGFTPERRTAVRRTLLNGALASFRKQSAIGSGEITTWKDREIGDPEFYAKALKPFVDKLEADAKLLTDEADAATVDRLFKEDMGPWADFKYYADEIREKYLRSKLTED